MKTKIFTLLITVFLLGCNTESKKQISNPEDYNAYLNSENKNLKTAQDELAFWENKLEATPNQFPYLAKKASAETQLFGITGDIQHLINAENYLIEVNKTTNYNEAGYLRALARNYISQHRFKEALLLLKKAETNGENLAGTQKMLFDVHMELGNNDKAKHYLEQVVDLNSFDYLIRTAKWNDHKGNLDAAIKYMEQAMAKTESSKIKSSMQWSYTNIADFYGHDGQIQKSYNYFLKALELNPNDAYAKKGIAWIIYSYERNPEEALRILNTITTNYKAPDYYLLKAEIAEFMKDETANTKYLSQYKEAVKDSNYGDMYNAYNIELLAETNPDSALVLSKKEIENRATAQTYDLLSWAHLQKGNTAEALKIAKEHVVNKTYEPTVLYHLAEIYKANNMEDELKPLKEELLGASYELGPIMETKIKQL
ncbi:tetratricopeptide repeat protein [Lacinutrix sp. MedPE-SW]|uniref:tetratricopeptide repeat protein n=1 Tax=Lacinutrix sp. MedPE-SW TaxID=1860087 RepID=UPI0009172202|nr:tetratricopeptide repeat protein [Lacinutrix sp. MedPE-SW]OIQ23087.1 MAG: cell surface protein [Lacinutrix sp. MedPE-SW]